MFTPTKIRSKAGIQRDGTRLASDYYVDGQWCRFQRELPRKIGGYVSKAQDLPERVYGISSFSANANNYLHLGSESQLAQRVISSMGALISSNDRTPAGLAADPNNIWQFDVFFDSTFGTVLIAHAAPNMDIASQTDTDIWYGDVTAAAPLVATGQDPISGGVIVVGNYLVSFGNGGLVDTSLENDIVGASTESSNVTQQKIVAGRRVRGGGVPAALLWSLDALVQMTLNQDTTPGASLWNFNTITDDTSILASRGVIEYDGVFYWTGVDRFLSYNGVVREVPNQMNVNFFFDNLNFAQRQKVFAYKVPRFGEIWWFFPFGDSTECNHAVILNVREGTWYDTEIPEGGRSDGIYAKVYFKPFLTGVTATAGRFDLWQHETGVNKVRLSDEQPIVSHFETKEFNLVEEGNADKSISVDIVEPDFIQAGDLALTISGRANARSPVVLVADNTKVVTETAADSSEQVIRFKTQFRLVTFKFETNTIDGNYEAGENLAHVQPADGRFTQ